MLFPSTQCFHQGNSYLLLKTQLRAQTALVPQRLDTALCSEQVCGWNPSVRSMLPCVNQLWALRSICRDKSLTQDPGLQRLNPDKMGTVC